MITANESKAQYDQSGAEIDLYLKHNVDPAITTAATSGKRSTHIHLGCISAFEDLWQKLTPTEKGAIDKLKEFGYTVTATKDGDAYVPRGQQDDNGNGPSVTNFGITIGW